MYENVLTQNQMVLAKKLLPVCSDFYLIGGTALALQIGHRRSIDFDLASYNQIDPFGLERKLLSMGFDIQTVFTATSDEFSRSDNSPGNFRSWSNESLCIGQTKQMERLCGSLLFIA
jgi:hypothetical protein